jgi:hypothetical protein
MASVRIPAKRGLDLDHAVTPNRHAGQTPFQPAKRKEMNGTGRKSEPPKKGNDKSKKPKHVPVEEDDYEDGDIATPKRDRTGDDDEPL